MFFSRFVPLLQRFPLEMLVGIAFSITGIFLLDLDFLEEKDAILLSFPLFFVLLLLGSVLAEKFSQKFSAFHLLWILFSSVCFGLSVWQMWNFEIFIFPVLQHFLWIFSLLFLTVALGFGKKLEKNENSLTIWTAAENTLSAFFIAFFSGIVVFLGINLFFDALKLLFDISISISLTEDSFFFSVGIVSTLAFLSFFPTQKSVQQHHFSAFAKMIGKFLFLPFSAVYLLLLYGYTAKILILSEIPNGFLASITAGFSALIVFTIFQIFPLQEEQKSEKNWVQKISRILALLLVPQAFLMIWAIWIRIAEYGVTENRYFLMAFGIFVLCTAIFWGFSKKISFRFPFFFLAFLLSFSSFGPFGAHQFSVSSQENRFFSILEKYQLIQNNEIQFPEKNPNYSEDDKNQLSSIIQYFSATTSNKELTKIINSSVLPDSRWEEIEKFKKKLFIPETGYSDFDSNMTEYFYNLDNTGVWESQIPKEYEKMISFQQNFSKNSPSEIFAWENEKILLVMKGEKIDMTEYIKENFSESSQNIFKETSSKVKDFVWENEKISVLIRFSYVDINMPINENNAQNFNGIVHGIVFFTEKNPLKEAQDI